MKPSAVSMKLGLIAGRGELPAITAAHLREQGYEVIAVGFDKETAKTLKGLTDRFHLFPLGQLGKLVNAFKESGVKTALMVGKIKKTRMFLDIRPDTRALRLWKKLLDRHDDTILKAFVDELAKDEIAIGRIDRYLEHLLAPPGKLARRSPDKRERADILLGWKLAREIGRLDLGQTVVVKNRAPIAIEAIEGTDQTITRAGDLAGPGTVVVKVSKPRQDFRFDVPVVGLETIRSMVSAKASVLAVEAGKTLFVQRPESLELLRKHKISFWGFSPGDFS